MTIPEIILKLQTGYKYMAEITIYKVQRAITPKVCEPELKFLCSAGCLFVLRFYGPVNPMGSCRAWSVYLTTRLLGRLSPVSS